MSKSVEVMEKIVALCRRRGFIFGSSEIYGGIGGFWDYGPLGCELKRNIRDAWWQDMVRNPPKGPGGAEYQMVGVDCSIIMNPKVWEASGHVTGFSDPMVDCRTEGCKGRFRADQLDATPCPLKPSKCAGQFDKCQLTEPRAFNLMFQTYVGALQDAANVAYLRPETAQGIFANFRNVMDSTRVKIPFGIAQVGKAFRNEINPRNYTFRSREFEQMEIEFFCRPEESMKWYEFWRDTRIAWYSSLGIRSEKLRPREQGDKELAHYSKACTDIEYMFPFSDEPQELEGVAHRGSFDLNQHGKFSKNDENAFAVVDDETKEKFVPHVIEPSAGVDRFTLAVICEAYSYDESRASPEFLKFHPRLAPIKAAVFPLVAKDGMPEIGEPIYQAIRKHFPCQYDAKQSIGKRYARMDEAGTPFCFTIDGQTKEDGTVTVRNRDDASQERIDKSRCVEYLRDKLGL
jgi:glycyl-tRNA synthetase